MIMELGYCIFTRLASLPATLSAIYKFLGLSVVQYCLPHATPDRGHPPHLHRAPPPLSTPISKILYSRTKTLIVDIIIVIDSSGNITARGSPLSWASISTAFPSGSHVLGYRDPLEKSFKFKLFILLSNSLSFKQIRWTHVVYSLFFLVSWEHLNLNGAKIGW
ncbi:hypothetical protein BDQ17DRAFT_235563 [Cyathus striatus]|nr:hypothetical protein BDQ17DRAFT_235563 [Cyathus striatus]